MEKIFFRVDSSNEIGSGHIYRCINLAKSLKNKYKIFFICRKFDGNLIHKIRSEKFKVLINNKKINYSHPKVWSKNKQKEDVEFIKKKLKKKYKFIISDHYGLGKTWGKRIKDIFERHLAIDDSKYFNKVCDFYLNYNFSEKSLNSKNKKTKYFCGQKFILNGHNILFKKKTNKKSYKRIFIFFGSVDKKNFTKFFYNFFNKAKFDNLKIDILVGINHKFRKKFSRNKKYKNVSLIYNKVKNFNKLYKKYDHTLTAANTTMYEQIKADFKPFVIAQNNDQTKVIKNLEKKKLIKKFNLKIRNKKKIKYLFDSHINFFERPESTIASLIKKNSTKYVAKKIDKIINDIK